MFFGVSKAFYWCLRWCFSGVSMVYVPTSSPESCSGCAFLEKVIVHKGSLVIARCFEKDFRAVPNGVW